MSKTTDPKDKKSIPKVISVTSYEGEKPFTDPKDYEAFFYKDHRKKSNSIDIPSEKKVGNNKISYDDGTMSADSRSPTPPPSSLPSYLAEALKNKEKGNNK